MCVTAISPLLQHLPHRLRASPPQEQQQLAGEGLALAMAMPLCHLSFDDLSPKLGGGTYGEVYPLKGGPLSGGPCKEAIAAAAAASDTRYAVKIFRLRGLVSLMMAAEEGQKELKPPEIAALKKATTELK